MNIDALKSLQKRIREATGPDAELDIAIADAFGRPTVWIGGDYVAERFTTDPDGLGACVALMREQFPDAEWERTKFGCFWIYAARLVKSPLATADRLANDCLTFIDAIIAARIAVIAEEQAREATRA